MHKNIFNEHMHNLISYFGSNANDQSKGGKSLIILLGQLKVQLLLDKGTINSR